MPYRVPKRVVEQAWSMPRGSSRTIRDGSRKYELTHTGKMVLVRFRAKSTKAFVHRVVAFPKPEHTEEFVRGSEHVRSKGPAQDNPGAIGTLSFRKLSGTNTLDFHSAQAHTNTTKTKGSPIGVHRRVFERYAGWRYHSLQNALMYAREKNLPFIISKENYRQRRFEARSSGALKNFRREIQRIADELGLEIIESDAFFRIQPKK